MAEEEVVKTDPVAVSISVMLLGSIGFQMLLFYLVNWPDPDIRKFSWQVISQTISIFCAVLLFQAFNGIVEEYVIEGGSDSWEVLVDMIQLVVWLTALQVVLALTSGAVNEMFGRGDPDKERAELDVKSWSVLFAHLSGFAAINAWGSLQQKVLMESPLMTLCAVPVGFFGLFFMYHGYDVIRTYISEMDDGETDEFEELWGEETGEAENDVAGLSLSFLTVQALRFQISGVLPNQEGLESWATSTGHTGGQWQTLVGSGAGFFVLSLLPLVARNLLEERIEALAEGSKKKVEKVLDITNNYFTFANAWCFFYGVKWAIASTHFTTENALLSVVLALLLSGIAFSVIFALDVVLDNQLLGDNDSVDTAADKMITALGILIGFSWEQCFDTAVTVIAEGHKRDLPPALSKLIMSLILVAIVFPAWRFYILRAERELASLDTQDKVVLNHAAHQHRELFLNKETDDHALDLAHLKMKHHRRRALGKEDPRIYAGGLRHLQVTTAGIVEVEEPREPARRKTKAGHQKEITESLLS